MPWACRGARRTSQRLPILFGPRVSEAKRICYQDHLTSCKRVYTAGANQSIGKDRRRPRTIFSAIQPTGIPHLGNYLGAIHPWVRLQNESEVNDTLIFNVCDLHSLTSRSQDVAKRRLSKKQTLAVLLASGLSPAKCLLFYQSSVSQHAELHWILSCDAGMGWLSRMPTWKDKLLSEMTNPNQRDSNVNIDIASLLQPSPNPKSQERLKLGLFSYPVLQAADILLYHATHVPVGADQLVHIEFARAMVSSFNAMYGTAGKIDPLTGKKRKGKQILTSPEAMISKAKRTMSLVEPGKKMSKSEKKEAGRILVVDDDEIIEKKIKSAVTDSIDEVSYDPDKRPGVSNLLEINANIDEAGGQEVSTPEDVANALNELFVPGSSRMRVLKDITAAKLVAHLKPIRERYHQLMGENAGKYLEEVAEQGRAKAEEKAKKTLTVVHEAVGI